MIRAILILVFSFATAGCLQSYPENPLSPDNGKACTQVGYVSNINVQFNYGGTLPARLMARVNGTHTFDECATGNTTEDYALVRNSGSSMSLAIWLRQGNGLRERYIDSDGEPKANATIHVDILGRDSCADQPRLLGQMNRAVNLEPVYINGGPSCGVDGYTAVIH